MRNPCRPARINVKVLIIVLVAVVALGGSLFAARQIRRSILTRRDFAAGQAAYEARDWPAAREHFNEFLGRDLDNVEILKKYAQAVLRVRPFEPAAIARATAAYRRVIRLDPFDEMAYEELATLCSAVGAFDELAYIARKRIDHSPDDKKAPLWLAEALIFQEKTQAAQEVLDPYIAGIKALPDRHEEYVRACLLMSRIARSDEAAGAEVRALEWLRNAVQHAPVSVKALVQRAQFYHTSPGLSGMSNEQRRDGARRDIEAADTLGTDDPQLRFAMGAIWMALGEFDRAGAELQALETLSLESLEEHYLDLDDWFAGKYLFASELALRRSAPGHAAALADETLTKLKKPRHRMRILPSAITVYVAADRVSDARRYLDEYTQAMYTHKGTSPSSMRKAYLQALVAFAEDAPYAVIDGLELALTEDAASPKCWRLLAAAYVRTGQAEQTVNTLNEYLRIYPQDGEMKLQLAQEYLKLRKWKQAFETAKQMESLIHQNIQARLFRIEAAVHLAGEQQDPDTVKLKALAGELTKLRENEPERADIRRLQAVAAVYLGLPDQAEQELRLALEECAEPLGVRLLLAQHYLSTQRMAAAIEVLKNACERHADLPEVWLSLARVQEASEDYDAARHCLRQGLEKVVGRWEKRSLSLRLATLELTHGERTAGMALLTELAEQDVRDIHARSLLLSVREIREDQATAAKLIEELREAEGESGLSWRFYQAALWMASNDWRPQQRAIADSLQFCLERNPQWLPPARLLLELYEKLGDFKRFEGACRRTLLRNPGAARIAYALVDFLEKQGRLVEAEEVLQQLQTDSPDATVLRVRVALGTGDVSRAIDELKLRASNDDRDADSRIFLGKLLYQETGDMAQAFAYLKEAQAIAPNSERLIAAKVYVLRAEERSEEAERLLDEYVTRENTFDAYRLRAADLSHEGEFALAEQDYRKLTTFTEQGAIGAMLLCRFYLRQDKLDAAVETLEQGLVGYPTDLRLKRTLLQTLFLRGRTQDQEKAFDILTALEGQLPHDPDLMKVRVAQLLKHPTPQSIQSAQEKLEQVVTLESTAVEAHLTLISIAMQKQEHERARNHVMRAIGANPDNPSLMSARSAVELALSNTPMASATAHLALQKDPQQTQALGVLLSIALKSRDPSLLEEVRDLLSAAIDEDPAPETLQIMQTQALVALGSRGSALEKLEAYCQTGPGQRSTVALVRLAGLHREAGDMDQARQTLDQAAQLAPNFPALIAERINWVTSLYRAGKADQAQTLFRELLARHPKNTSIFNNLAWLLQDRYQRHEEALELVNQGLSLAPNDLHLLDTRGTIYLKLDGRLAEAKQDFTRQVELAPAGTARRAKALLQLGRICAKNNDFAQANQHLMHALAIDRNTAVFTPEERSEITKIMESEG